MVGEAKMRPPQTNGSDFPPGTVADNLGHFAHDVVTLAELQYELFKSDASNCVGDVARSSAIGIGSVAIALGTIPVLLLAVAYGIHAAGLPMWASALIASGIGLASAAAFGFIAVRGLQKSTTAFASSKNELKQNVDWLKFILRRKSTPTTSATHRHDTFVYPQHSYPERTTHV